MPLLEPTASSGAKVRSKVQLAARLAVALNPGDAETETESAESALAQGNTLAGSSNGSHEAGPDGNGEQSASGSMDTEPTDPSATLARTQTMLDAMPSQAALQEAEATDSMGMAAEFSLGVV